ncbi:hypothetical protein JKP88DRAFT_181491 [Tribonema minus]|uniref:Uncharacterized protein n=1 Tax=Tribonema minus TaxID=303371 RepID=A0A835YYW8_9STRA|nr:hypothetical protein JKP88DRAFT_181491 [Tribonema minus]
MDVADFTTSIRVDSASNKGSVIDVIRLVIPNLPSNQASTTFARLASEMPDVASSCCHLRINGKGKPTPCADAKTLVEIVWSLPGKAARDFRRESANTVCRLLGGDLSLVQEIESRHHALQKTEGGHAVQGFLMSDTLSAASQESDTQLALMPAGFAFLDETSKQQVALSMVHDELAKRKRADDAEWHRRKFADTTYFMRSLQEQHILDPNLRIALIDQLKNIASSPSSGTPLLTAEAVHENYCTVAGWLSQNTTNAEYQKVPFTSKFGKEMSRAYRKKHGCANAHTTDKHVNGEVRKVMCYDVVEDGDLFEEVLAGLTA